MEVVGRIDERLLNIALHSEDFAISPPYELPKRYILRKVDEIPEWLDLRHTMSCFRELGKTEWEVLLAMFFLTAIEDAEQEGKTEADITRLFQHDYMDRRERKVSKERVTEHLMPWFTKDEETEDTVYLTFNLKKKAA